MIVLLADSNIGGQIDLLVKRMQAEPWIGFWDDLHLSQTYFSDVGLDLADSDAVVWHRCQEKRLLLLTSNRNDDGPDSLETTIRIHNTPQSLPVFTIGDAKRVLRDRDYATEVIWGLFEYLYDLEHLHGTGRLYVP